MTLTYRRTLGRAGYDNALLIALLRGAVAISAIGYFV